ncbi:MAG: AIR carboxylase family protein [Halobacteriovoraceae bacterium]|jgi:5-(carboxyamino)imidazole ribonucleotide mutase|nr:AIR carboxylase family protein [Halobacteriovoraceae bacterium]
MKILVVFGSHSDDPIALPLTEGLQSNYEANYKVISAHRNPEELAEELSSNIYDCVIAGAGLAAHLPGVVASKVSSPVFGIPVKSNFGGLDALLSVQQMPFGVPVICTPPNEGGLLIPFIESIKNKNAQELRKIHIVSKSNDREEYVRKEKERTLEFAGTKEIDLTIGTELLEGHANIVWVENPSDIRTTILKDTPVLHVPLLDNDLKNDPAQGLVLFNWVEQGGLWIGVNNTRNALLSYLKFS